MDTCLFAGCETKARARGLCAVHYPVERKSGRLSSYPLERIRGRKCEIDGCTDKHYAFGLCNMHWARHRRHGDATICLLGERGAGTVTKEGYRRLYRPGHPNATPGGFIEEHRIIMAESLGRALLPHENVHHKNGDRLDNRLVKGHELKCPGTCCNLELWSKKQPPGQRVTDKLAWAREIIALYGHLAPQEDDQ